MISEEMLQFLLNFEEIELSDFCTTNAQKKRKRVHFEENREDEEESYFQKSLRDDLLQCVNGVHPVKIVFKSSQESWVLSDKTLQDIETFLTDNNHILLHGILRDSHAKKRSRGSKSVVQWRVGASGERYIENRILVNKKKVDVVVRSRLIYTDEDAFSNVEEDDVIYLIEVETN